MIQKEQEERNQKEGARRKEQEKKIEKLFSLNIKIKQANLEKEIPVGGVQVLVRAEINIKKIIILIIPALFVGIQWRNIRIDLVYYSTLLRW